MNAFLDEWVYNEPQPDSHREVFSSSKQIKRKLIVFGPTNFMYMIFYRAVIGKKTSYDS